MISRSVKDCLVIGVAAVIFRAVILSLWGYSHPHAQLIGDCEVHMHWAESLAQGHGFHSGFTSLARRVPGYAIFLAVFMKAHLFPWGVWITQAFLNVASVLWLYFLTKNFFNAGAAAV